MPIQYLHSLDDSSNSADVVIIGAGVVGLSSAFWLARSGLKVIIVERYAHPFSLASSRSGEGLRAQWESPRNILLNRAGISLYEKFGELIGDESNDAGLRQIGYLYASRTARGAERLRARVAGQNANGLDSEFIEPAEVARRFPLLSEDVTGAAFRQRDGVIDIRRILAGYTGATDAAMLLGTEVLEIQPRSGGVNVVTSRGTIAAGDVVIAGGPHSAALVAPFAPLPLIASSAAIAYVVTDGVPFDHPVTIDVELGSFWRPDHGGARITSSFARIAEMEPGMEEPARDAGYVSGAVASVTPLTPAWATFGRNIRDTHVRIGALVRTADSAPVVGAVPGQQHIHLNTGYGGHGIMASIEGSRRLSVLLTGGKLADPLEDLSADRLLTNTELTPDAMISNRLADEPTT